MSTLLPQSQQEQSNGRLWKLPFNSLAMNEEGVLTLDRTPPPSKHVFQYGGLTVNLFVSHKTPEVSVCRMWANVAVLPYTAENTDARKNVLDILRASQKLEDVKFAIERDQRIIALFEKEYDGDYTLDILMLEIIDYLRQAEPFSNLIKQYISKY